MVFEHTVNLKYNLNKTQKKPNIIQTNMKKIIKTHSQLTQFHAPHFMREASVVKRHHELELDVQVFVDRSIGLQGRENVLELGKKS